MLLAIIFAIWNFYLVFCSSRYKLWHLMCYLTEWSKEQQLGKAVCFSSKGCSLLTVLTSLLLSEKSPKCILKLLRHCVCMNTDWFFFIRNTLMPLNFALSEISGRPIREKTPLVTLNVTTMQTSSVTWNSYIFTTTWSIPKQNTGVYFGYGVMQKQRIYFCNLLSWG